MLEREAVSILDHVIDDVLEVLVLLAEFEPLTVSFLVKRRNVDISLLPVADVVRVFLISFDLPFVPNGQKVVRRRVGLHHALVCDADCINEALSYTGALGSILFEFLEQGNVLLVIDLTELDLPQLLLCQLVHNFAIAQVHMLELVHLRERNLVAVLVAKVYLESQVAASIVLVH